MENTSAGYALNDSQLKAVVRRDIKNSLRDSELPFVAKPHIAILKDGAAGVTLIAACVIFLYSDLRLLAIGLGFFPIFYFLRDLPKTIKDRRFGLELVIEKESLVVRSLKGIVFSSPWNSIELKDIGFIDTNVGFKYLRSLTLGTINSESETFSSYTIIKSAYRRRVTGTIFRKLLDAHKLVVDQVVHNQVKVAYKTRDRDPGKSHGVSPAEMGPPAHLQRVDRSASTKTSPITSSTRFFTTLPKRT